LESDFNMRFSPSKMTFYPQGLDYSDAHLPADLVEVPQAAYAAAMVRRGDEVLVLVDGELLVRPAPVPAHAELVNQALREARQIRSPILAVLDGMQASALVLANHDQAVAIEGAKQGLKDITQIDLTGCATLAEMRRALTAACAGIAGALPLAQRVAFEPVLAG
jgi:hypothetical protein